VAADKSTITVEAFINSRDAREFANKLGSSLTQTATTWRDEMKKMTAEGHTAGMKVALASGQSGAALKKFLQSNVTGVYADFMKELRQGNIAAAEKLSRTLDKRTRRLKEDADDIAKAFEKMGKRQAQTYEQRAKGFQSKMEGLDRGARGGISGWGGMGRGAIDRMRQAGLERQGRAQKQMQAAKEAGKGAPKSAVRMAKVGKGLAGAARALGAIGAALAVVVLLVKAFIDLDDKMKSLRKTVLSTTSAMDFGFGQGAFAGYQVTGEIDKMRDQVNKAARDWNGLRATTEEHLKVIAAYGQAGVRMSQLRGEIKDASNEMKGYADLTSIAITYSRALGEGMEQTAATMGKIRMETGLSLTQVGEAYAMIAREAEQAGFQTKRFFSTVVEATSGLFYYNVRLQEAASLLTELVTTLGEQVGTEVFKSIAQEQQVGVETAIKRYFLAGSDYAKKIFKLRADQVKEGLFKDITGATGKKGVSGADVLKKEGIETDEDLARAIKDPKRAAKLRAALKDAGMGEMLGRLQGLSDLMGAAAGDLSAVARATSQLGIAGKVGMLLKPAGEVFGGKTFDEIVFGAKGKGGAVAMKALEDLAKELGYQGNMQQLAEQVRSWREEAEAEGVKEKDFEEYVMNRLATDTVAGFGAEVKEDVKLARQVAGATESINKILQENVLGVLIAIHGTVVRIWEAITFSGKPEQRAAYKEAQRALKEEEAAAQKELTAARKTATQKRAAGGTPAEVAAAEKKVTAAGQRLSTAQQRMGELQEGATAIEAGAGVGTATTAGAAGKKGLVLTDEGDATGTYQSIVKSWANFLDQYGSKIEWQSDESLTGYYATAQEMMQSRHLDDYDLLYRWALNNAYNQVLARRDAGEFGKVDADGEVTNEEAMQTALTGRLSHFGRQALDDLARTMLPAGDAIIFPPGRGSPIATDPGDTIMAMKPGGPLAGALGGSKAPVNLNIYGGDQKKVYDTVMRVLKATGHA
jgi:hypothetical protein